MENKKIVDIRSYTPTDYEQVKDILIRGGLFNSENSDMGSV